MKEMSSEYMLITLDDELPEMPEFEPHYLLIVDRKNNTDTMELQVEVRPEYYSDENLSLESIAKHIGISKYYLSRVFKNKLHKSISSYLNEYRIKRAKELLKEDFISLKNCHFLVGFKDYTYFSTQFKRYEGCSPANYIKKFKNEIK